MWTRLDPKYMMGSLNYPEKDNYYRVDLPQDVTKNPKHKAVLQYGSGCFFAIKTATSFLRIKYSVHYSRKNPEYYPLKFGAEVIVFAKINGAWELLNHWQDTLKPAGNIQISLEKEPADEQYVLNFDLSRHEVSEFQICLPSQGRIFDNIEIESASKISYIYKDPKFIIAGSSIAAFTSTSAASSLQAIAFRKFGINVIGCGISGDHTFNCKELISEISKTKIPVIVMDLLHIHEKTFLKYKDNKRYRFLVISPVAVQYERFSINKYADDHSIEVVHITGEGHADITHLNSSGVNYYLQILKKKGII